MQIVLRVEEMINLSAASLMVMSCILSRTSVMSINFFGYQSIHGIVKGFKEAMDWVHKISRIWHLRYSMMKELLMFKT